MRRLDRPARSRIWPAMALLAALAFLPSARAQDNPDGEPEDPPVPQAPQVAVGITFANGPDARARWESRLSAEIDRIDRACGLTVAQKAKLQLAGRGDVKRAFDRVEAAQRKLRAPDRERGEGEALRREMDALQVHFRAGLFGEGSVLAKMAGKVLSDDQMGRYRAEVREQRRFRHRVRVDLVIQVFDAAAGCTDEQRQRLATLLLQETRLPARPDQDFMVVLAQAARLPEARFKAILDEAQWRPVAKLLKELDGQLKQELEHAVLEPADPGPVAARGGTLATDRK